MTNRLCARRRFKTDEADLRRDFTRARESLNKLMYKKHTSVKICVLHRYNGLEKKAAVFTSLLECVCVRTSGNNTCYCVS